MDASGGALDARVEEVFWPLVEALLDPYGLAGVAVAVVREGGVVVRGFGVRDLRTREPVTTRTLFHLASVSKPFVATAVVSLGLGLDAPATRWIPELVLADGRQDELTLRRLLSHTSGLGDVSDYGWVDPQHGDDALLDLARSLAGWRLQASRGRCSPTPTPGTSCSGWSSRARQGRASKRRCAGCCSTRWACGRARSCAPRYPRSALPRPTSAGRSRCRTTPTPTPAGTPRARRSTPTPTR